MLSGLCLKGEGRKEVTVRRSHCEDPTEGQLLWTGTGGVELGNSQPQTWGCLLVFPFGGCSQVQWDLGMSITPCGTMRLDSEGSEQSPSAGGVGGDGTGTPLRSVPARPLPSLRP